MWKDIPGYENIYKIDENGNVKSFARDKDGILKQPQIDKHGYATVLLWNKGSYKMMFIHRLVLMAFKPCNNMNELHVNHKDANPLNNNIDNLEWVTQKENNAYIEKIGHHSGRSKKRVLVEFRNGEKKEFNSLAECAHYFNVNKSTIQSYIKIPLSKRKRKIDANFSFIEEKA